MTKSLPIADVEMQRFQALFEHETSAEVFGSWFSNIGISSNEEDRIVTVTCSTRFKKDYIQENYGQLVQDCFLEMYGDDYTVQFKTGNPQKVLRGKPIKDEQLDFFVPMLTETSIRDEIHLMEVAPFTLSKRESRTKLVYTNLNGMNLTITCNPDYGMMTAHDYDFVLMMMSHLNVKANEWRDRMRHWEESGKVGEPPQKPGRVFRPHTNDIIKFMRREKGGRNYAEIEAMLDRLTNCAGKIERTGRRKRRAGSFNFITKYDAISRSDTGNILEVEVTVPDWIYDGIVRQEAPTLLTVDPDYMLINKPLGKFLWRFSRLHAKKDEYEIDFKTLHHRSGSKQILKEFNKELKNYIEDLNDLEGTENAFPDYVFTVTGKPRAHNLYIRFRDKDDRDLIQWKS